MDQAPWNCSSIVADLLGCLPSYTERSELLIAVTHFVCRWPVWDMSMYKQEQDIDPKI